MTPNSDIALAVRRALFMSAVAATGASTVPSLAQAQETQDQPAADEQRVETVTVTGSRIRRVDEETAAPVFVLDAAQIQSSGVTTLGDLIQRVPAISGAATNPQVNNGGGTGETNVELRGLGAQRTLVLLDGKRLGVLGANGTVSAVDVNLIPINLIERVEILKAILREADLLILDEPTSNLAPTEVADLLKILRSLRAEGKGIIFISHKLPEVLELCDEVVVLRDGRVSGRAPAASR